ncbi:MAG: hypothetical protein QM682_12120 [Paracoccus sp. (in: a-proteobacteria)]
MANFSGSSLRGGDFQHAEISQEQINASFADESAKLPKKIHWPSHWPTWDLGPFLFHDEWHRWHTDPAGYEPPLMTNPIPN